MIVKTRRVNTVTWSGSGEGGYTFNISREARGLYRVTYFNDAHVFIETEIMRDGFTNVLARIEDWLLMKNR